MVEIFLNHTIAIYSNTKAFIFLKHLFTAMHNNIKLQTFLFCLRPLHVKKLIINHVNFLYK